MEEKTKGAEKTKGEKTKGAGLDPVAVRVSVPVERSRTLAQMGRSIVATLQLIRKSSPVTLSSLTYRIAARAGTQS